MKQNRIARGIAAAAIATATLMGTAACNDSDANVTSENLSKDADNFKIERRVVFFNGITDKYLLTIEGLCSINTDDAKKLAVTCKTGANTYKKHYLGLSDNVTYFVEQTVAAKEDPYHYKVVFKPESIIPDIKFNTSGNPQSNTPSDEATTQSEGKPNETSDPSPKSSATK